MAARTKLSDQRPAANAMVYVWRNGDLLVPRLMRSVWYGVRYPDQEWADGETYYESNGNDEWGVGTDHTGVAVMTVR